MTTRSRRFAFVTTFYPPYNFGGDGIAVRRLATLLASQGHHVEVIHDVNSFQALRPAGMAADGEYQDHPAIIHHGLRSTASLRPSWKRYGRKSRSWMHAPYR